MGTGTGVQTGQEDVFTLNPYGIVIRPLTRIQGIRSMAHAFGNDLISYLDGYEKQRVSIVSDSKRTPDVRLQDLRELQKKFAGPLGDFATRAEAMSANFSARLTAMIDGMRYVSNNLPEIETMNQIETRKDLGKLNKSELSSIFMSPETSDFVFTAIIGAAVPVLAKDILNLGVESRIKIKAPEILDYKAGAAEVLEYVVSALRRSYRYIDQPSPDNRLDAINLDQINFSAILSQPKFKSTK